MSRPTRGRGRGTVAGRTSSSPFAWASAPPTSSSGSYGKRAIVPNFAAAGRPVELKTEPKTEPKITSPERKGRNSNLDHINSNRGKGRPRGKRTHREEQRIIQSEGIFSQGFGEEDMASKRSKLKNIKGEETVVGRLESPVKGIERTLKTETEDKKEVLRRAPKSEVVDTSNAYARHWQSDEEMDKEELDELLKDGFISDLKKGSKMPFVLPSKDEPQFRKLVNKRGRNEDAEMEDKSSKFHQDKFHSAGNSLRQALSNGSNSVAFFQLPPTSLHPMAIDSQQLNASNPPNLPKRQHSFDGMPTGTQIGKLQFLRSGRVVMNIGGQRMDIAQAIPSNCYETLLRIETESPAQPPSASLPTTSLTQQKKPFPEFNNGAPFVNPCSAFALPSNRLANSAQLLGEVSGQFVCLFDVQRSTSAGNGYS
ncbi:hypothetical protein niasHS_003520 [Heterodera schachtii]|uniref:Uncharacterized protein n=1 Tax=Heterodera schachtii TaxID=97005 RepID=A0ABD2KGR8_HETSC